MMERTGPGPHVQLGQPFWSVVCGQPGGQLTAGQPLRAGEGPKSGMTGPGLHVQRGQPRESVVCRQLVLAGQETGSQLAAGTSHRHLGQPSKPMPWPQSAGQVSCGQRLLAGGIGVAPHVQRTQPNADVVTPQKGGHVLPGGAHVLPPDGGIGLAPHVQRTQPFSVICPQSAGHWLPIGAQFSSLGLGGIGLAPHVQRTQPF